MKFSATIAIAAAGTLVAAEHHHAHQHAHKRDTVATTTVDKVVTLYELDGTPIPVAEVCQGIKDGEYKWADGVAPAGACTTSSSITAGAVEFIQTSSSTSSSTKTSTSTTTTSSTPSPTHSSTSTSTSTSSTSIAPSPAASSSSPSSGGTGVDSTFPDGELSCDTFPSQYGAVPLPYHGLGGWTGIQYVALDSLGKFVDAITTAVSGQSCTEGAMCSYQCPDGYLKSQWPITQGSTGQSVGGITCTGGKLHRTNLDYETLCIAGIPALSVQNTLSESVCICRTDYPGTESETLPTCVSPGQTVQLANPDGDSYYEWQGKSTSAQYYLNPAGASEELACTWGSAGQPYGNFAPMNLGLGFKGGMTWASIFPNKPTTSALLPYNVKYEGDISGECSWDAGSRSYSSGSTSGCTVSIPKGGSATLVLS